MTVTLPQRDASFRAKRRQRYRRHCAEMAFAAVPEQNWSQYRR
jgi:hypothetical protein